MNQYFLTDFGVCSALGIGSASLRATWEQAIPPSFTSYKIRSSDRTVLVASVDEFASALNRNEVEGLYRKFSMYRSRNMLLAEICVRQIEDRVSSLTRRYGDDRVAVVVATSTSGISEGVSLVDRVVGGESAPVGYDYSQQEIGALSEFIRFRLGLRGVAYTVSTACSSSAKVFQSARGLIEIDAADAVVVGGIDSLSPLTIEGFGALELLAPCRCNPFSRNRVGITIGEGGALFVMEQSEGAVQLVGVGESSDAYHPSTPDPSGSGAYNAISAALHDGNRTISEVGYINLHGTGTSHNDLMESKALRLAGADMIPSSSTKPWVGHTLGASGAIEAAICYEFLRDGGRVPPRHLWDGDQDPEIGALNLVDREMQMNSSLVLSNSFGFGGSNSAILLGRS